MGSSSPSSSQKGVRVTSHGRKQGQRTAKRGEEEGDSKERETRQGAAKRRAEVGRGKQNQNKEDSGAKTRRGTSSLSHCILEELAAATIFLMLDTLTLFKHLNP